MFINRWVIPIIFDVLACFVTLWFSYYLRMAIFYQTMYPQYQIELYPLMFSTLILIPLLIFFSTYQSFIRYSGLGTFIQLGKALFIYSIIFSLIFTFFGVANIPRSIGLMQPFFLSFTIFISRAFIRYFINNFINIDSKLSKQNLLIYGAGFSGIQLANLVEKNPKMHLIGFLDDNKDLWGSRIDNKKVYCPDDINKLIKIKKIDNIFIAISSLDQRRRSYILSKLQKYLIPVKTLPNINNLIDGKINLSSFKTPDLNDLLGRDTVKDNYSYPNRRITEKVVLITGGGGSIGSEIFRQVIQLKPKKIIVIELNEYSLYKIKQDTENYINNLKHYPQFIFILGSIENKAMVKNIFLDFNPDIVFHAAAYKHVNIVEENPIIGLYNNVFGTLNLAKIAIKYNTPNFILISTDKAVRPTNIMGATKKLAEMILLSLSKKSKITKFSIVRFGNVLGSSGSVIPKFNTQINNGGPITLTHPNIKRFFMTISEAVQLVIETANLANGGEVFILKMGKLIKIKVLAEKLINLSGKTLKDKNNPNGDIEIKITGLLPGEKLYEEILTINNAKKTTHPKILKATEKPLNWDIINQKLKELKTLMKKSDITGIKEMLVNLDIGYNSKK